MSHSSALPFLLCFMLVTSLATAGRQLPAVSTSTSKPTEKKVDKECLEQEGSVLIPGIGRYMIGSHESIPSFTDLDHSGTAAATGRYLPGNDDTFVPNPGFEVPNPVRGFVNP